MAINTSNTELSILKQNIDQVDYYKYLGTHIDTTIKDNSEIKIRRGIAFSVFWDMKNIWKAKELSLKLKLQIFHATCLPILLYGCETWILTRDLINKLDSFATICYRYILQISKLEKIKNDKILNLVDRKPLHVIIQERQSIH